VRGAVSVITPPEWSMYFNGSMLKPGVDFYMEQISPTQEEAQSSRVHEYWCTHITLTFHVFRGESLILFHSSGARIVRAEEDINKGTVISV